MKEFRDDQGRPWMVALTVAAADRVRGLVTIDVTDDVEQPDGSIQRQTRKIPFDLIDAGSIQQTLEVLRSNFGKIGEILYAICRQQCDDKKLTKEQFLDGLRGDALEAGVKALESELVDFFPTRLRRMVGLLVAKMDEMAGELMARAEAGLEAATVETLVAQSGTPSTKPQASSESIPASGRSEISSSPATAA
ncbi:MAG: hypothetical protein ACK48S_00430 [Planctomycetia bacterium]|jgi:hypothetical protein